jgi:hypothetical protein
MTRIAIAIAFALALIPGFGASEVVAQAPTISPGSSGSDLGPGPGARGSRLGPAPGEGASPFRNAPGQGDAVLGGRPGTSSPRILPSAVQSDGAGDGSFARGRIAPPSSLPIVELPVYGPVNIRFGRDDESPEEFIPEVEDEGPPDGLQRITFELHTGRHVETNRECPGE